MTKAQLHLASAYGQAISLLLTIAALTPYEQGQIADLLPVTWKPRVLIFFGFATAACRILNAHTVPTVLPQPPTLLPPPTK